MQLPLQLKELRSCSPARRERSASHAVAALSAGLGRRPNCLRPHGRWQI